MLIVSNGAFKSGSTWLFSIAKMLIPYESVPEQYQNPGWKNASLDPGKLEEFVKTADFSKVNYLVKNHLEKPEQREFLTSNPLVRVLNIERDLKDVIVSAYHHDIRIGKYEGEFPEYYWGGRGKKRISQLVRYHQTWIPTHPSIFLTRYEALQDDFENQTRLLAKFLSVPELSQERIAEIHDKTSFTSVQKREKEKQGQADILFHRKGVVGDWVNYLDKKMLADLEKTVRSLQ